MDSLVDRILELESMTETISANDRRFIAIDDTDAFVHAQQNENTSRMMDCHIKLFATWLRHMDEMQRPDEISPKELDLYIAKFILSIRKQGNGQLNDPERQYQPQTLLAMHSSIHRYLCSKNYQCNIKADDIFKHSRDVLAAKQKELKQLGKGNKPQAAQPFTDDDIMKMFQLQILGIGMLTNHSLGGA